jgi:putative ABC transport system permease protein
MRRFWRDLSYGARGLRNQPGFASIAILTLALGIGAATTIFSIIYNVLLDPFPYNDAKRVVAIQIHDLASSNPGGRQVLQTAEFLDYQEQSHVFEEVVGGSFKDALQSTAEGTEQFSGGATTPNMFRFLGVPAMLGRALTPDDAAPGAPPVFVMSYKLWSKRYGLDHSIVNQTFVLNGIPTTLVGIMPPRFTKMGADLWWSVSMNRADSDMSQQFWMFQGKLKPGVTLQQAQAEIDLLAHRLAKVYPLYYPDKFRVQVVSWVDSLIGPFRKTLYILAAAVGLLLLISCANVANMLLARAAAREKEMAIRGSLGATPSELIRQLLTESLLLALAGGALGCVFSYVDLKGIVALIPDGMIPGEVVMQLNVPVLLFSLGVAIFTALIFGLVPALHSADQNLAEPLKESGRGVSGGFRRGRLRNALVIAEVALSLVLLAGAGLMMRTFIAMQQVDLGFRPNNLLLTRLPLPKGQYKTTAQKQRFFRQLLARLDALPGVVAATTTTTVPPFGGIRSEIDIPGKAHYEKWNAIYTLCSEGYFPTIGLKVLRGRVLSEFDVNDGRRVAVISQTLVNRFFGNEDPIGRKIKISMLENMPEGKVENPVFEVIGVVSNTRNQGIQDPALPEMYIPYTMTGTFDRALLVRTVGNPAGLTETLRREIWAVDRNVALTFTGTLEDFLTDFVYAQPRFGFVLLAIFGGVGLVLITIGVYSVISYTVSGQTQEIGLRMALGAADSDVMGMVLWMGLRLIGAGVVAGLLLTFAAMRIVSNQLYGISAYDPMTLAVVIAAVVVAGLAACYWPARRATQLDPMVALRYE